MPSLPSGASDCYQMTCESAAPTEEVGVSQNDTAPEDTCVVRTHGVQLAIFLARKLLDEPESSSTEIVQPLYCRRSSATETPRLPRTIVPTRWTPPSRVADWSSSNARPRSSGDSPENASCVQTRAPSWASGDQSVRSAT